MKLLKSLLVFLTLFHCTNIIAQEGIQQYSSPIPSVGGAYHFYTTTCSNGATINEMYVNTSSVATGKKSWQGSYDATNKCYNANTEEYLTGYIYDFTLPTNAILISVKIKAFSSTQGYIVEAPLSLFNQSASDIFSTIKGGSSLCSFPTVSSDNNWINITSYASQSIMSNNSFIIGAHSNGSYSLSPDITCDIVYKIPAHISFQNNMGGQLSVNGSNYTGSFSDNYWLGTNISLSVNEPQTDASGSTWVWNDSEAPSNKSRWDRIKYGNPSFRSNDQSYGFSVTADDHNSTYEAKMRKVCNLTFTSAGGTVYVDWNSYSSPYTSPVVDQNSVYAFAAGYTANGLDYTFMHWDNNPNSNTITASANATYTAVFTAKPSIANRNQQITSGIGELITLAWNANPNQYVTEYHVYRKIGHTGTPSHIATTSNTTFTDPDYRMTGDSEDTYLMYDVRPYYSVNQTESDPYFQSAAFGRIEASTLEDKLVASLSNELPIEYSISNYPNPFNPTTTINYQLPENGFVSIKVYDLLGKEVAILVNESKSAGFHNVTFDAGKLTSGVYIYTINAGKYTQSKKMILMK